jgi:ketosteroid isomerase-like protein
MQKDSSTSDTASHVIWRACDGSVVDREAILRSTYDAFNRRDIDAVLALLTDDVDWPNAWEGGRLQGRAAVRDYWERQWAAIDGKVFPIGFAERPDGRIAVEVDQIVRDLDGGLISHGRVAHVYTFHGELITRMEVEQAAPG